MGDLDIAQFREYLRTLTASGGGVKEWSEEHGVSWQYLSNVMRGHQPPGKKVLRAVGFERVIYYRPIAIPAPKD